MTNPVIHALGTKRWYNQNGQYHRLDGPAIEWCSGDREWYVNGEKHRLDGPAVEWSNGSYYWYKNGKRHCLSGPAVRVGGGTIKWYINNTRLTEKKWSDHPDRINYLIQQNLNLILNDPMIKDNEDDFYFISYGSNMLLNRIKKRTPSITVIDVIKLPGYKLVFNKKSKDGSTKANLVESTDDHVYCVLHKIKVYDKPKLDKAESLGKGYNIKLIKDNTYAYVCEDNSYKAEGNPYTWYLNFLIEGAKENDFPEEYINYLKSFDSVYDMNEKRRLMNYDVIHN